MSKLSELNIAVRRLNDLWVVCADADEKEKIAGERDELDALAEQLAHLSLKEGTEELDDAITALNEVTAKATAAEQEIKIVGKSIERTAEAINAATNAIAKVVGLIAKL